MTRMSVFALATILALGSLSFVADASAKGGGHGGSGGGHGGGGHGGGGGHVGGGGGGGHVSGGHAVAAPSAPGHIAPGHIAPGRVLVGPRPVAPVVTGRRTRVHVTGGHRRHFWHARWRDDGVGPAWRRAAGSARDVRSGA